jgi:hypothetical protein
MVERMLLSASSNEENINVSAYSSSMGPFLAIVVFVMIFYYAEAGTPIHTYVTVFMCYYSAFMFLLLIPADTGSTVFFRRGDLSEDEGDKNYDDMIALLRPQYATYYIVITILSNSVLLFQEYYNTDGYFSFLSRCRSVLRRMGFEYSIYAAVGIIIFSILVANGADADALVLTLILLSNTVNLFLLMFILGFGMIGFPMSMWNKSDMNKVLSTVQNSAAAQFQAVNDLMLDHSKSVADLRKTHDRLASMQSAPELLEVADAMLAKCPDEFRSSTLGKPALDKDGQITLDTLAQLNTRLKQHRLDYQLAQSKLDTTKLEAYRAEDVIKCLDDIRELKESGGGELPDKRIYWSINKTYSTSLEFRWWTEWRSMYYKFLSVLFAILSIFGYLGIIGSFKGSEEEVSVYYSATHDENASAAGIAIFVLLTLGYVAAVTSWALFQFRFSGIMEMVPYRTTSTSLSFNARMIGRLAPPLAFFYLGWIYENGIRQGSWLKNEGTPPITMTLAFVRFYKIDVLPLIGDFTLTFPVFLLITSVLVLFNIFNRIMIWLRLPNCQFGDAIVTEEKLREGKRQIERHRKLMERAARRYSFKNLLRGATDSGEDEPTTNFFQRLYRWMFRRWFDSRTDDSAGNDLGKSLFPQQDTPPAAPVKMAGMLEKSSKKLSDRWQNKFFLLSGDEVGYLVFWKSEKDSRIKSEEGSLDLEDATDFIVNENGSTRKGANLKMEIQFASSEPVLLRFPSEEDAARWKEALKKWKDYKLELREYKASRPISERGAREGETSSPMAAAGARVPRGRISITEVEDYENAQDEKALNAHLDLNASLADIDIGDFGNLDAVVAAGSSTAVVRHDSVVSTSSDVAPAQLEGWLEQKQATGMTAFKKRFCVVSADDGAFLVYDNKTAFEKGQNLILSIDIHAMDIKSLPNGKGISDGSRFCISDGTHSEEFKVPPIERSKGWVEELERWNDYLLMRLV